MSDHKYSKEHLFRINTKKEIYNFIYNLKYFVFYRAIGGHANDPDELKTAIAIKSKLDLNKILREFNVSENIFDNQDHIHVIIFNFPFCLSEGNNYLIITSTSGKNGDKYSRGNTDYLACKKIEKFIELQKWTDRVPHNLLKRDSRAITIEKYSDYFL